MRERERQELNWFRNDSSSVPPSNNSRRATQALKSFCLVAGKSFEVRPTRRSEATTVSNSEEGEGKNKTRLRERCVFYLRLGGRAQILRN